MLTVTQLPALTDNYIYLLRDEATGTTAVVDPSEAAPVIRAVGEGPLHLVLNTHHHWDHTGGNPELASRYGAQVMGFGGDAGRIPALTQTVADGGEVWVGKSRADVLFIPGHTKGHIAYHFGEDRALFCGDTLFTLGCGRLFEGTAEQMWESLRRLRALPDGTRVFCGHEYTEANARFALALDPENEALRRRAERVRDMRRQGRPTVPSTLAEERLTNPFLRADDPDLQRAVGLSASPVAVFAEIRKRKDRF